MQYTFFTRNTDTTPHLRNGTWSELCNWIATCAPVANHKDNLPLVKLATFNGPRSNATLMECHGIEADYDGEVMSPEAAVARLWQTGIEALIYTSPSHRDDAPRWRVLCPLGTPCNGEARAELVGRLNAVLGGVLARESFTLAQAYYVGSVAGGVPLRAYPVTGNCIDTVQGLPDAVYPAGREPHSEHVEADKQARSLDELRAVVDAIPNDAPDWERWKVILGAIHTAGRQWPDEAYNIACEWSSRCTVDQPTSSVAHEWQKLNRSPMPKLGIGKLRYEAGMTGRAMIDPITVFGPDDGSGADTTGSNRGYYSMQPQENGKPSSTLEMVKYCLNLPVAYDEFRDRVVITEQVPWDKVGPFPRNWTDMDSIYLQMAGQGVGLTPSKETARDAAYTVADANRFHPIRDYLRGLQWDGVPRIDTWLADYLGAERSDYTRLVGAKWLIGAVARVMQPGCKMDASLILEGRQNAGKSTVGAILAGDEFFTDHLPDMRDKDAMQTLRGNWIIEMGELSGMRKAEVEDVKKFLTARIDKYRPPYGRELIDQPRQCVFMGTTNEDEYLKDVTGNRRFWPVRCADLIDLERLGADRGQLWAEAMHRYAQGETWWLDRENIALAEAEQAKRLERDPLEDDVLRVVEAEIKLGNPIRTVNILKLLNLEINKINEMKVANLLKINGWRKITGRVDNRVIKLWKR